MIQYELILRVEKFRVKFIYESADFISLRCKIGQVKYV